ncbi:uncharacterized protein LOC116338373 [Contarinia nasturtii]|uniref:uncharacterized protein LOC116338373 n=1 Tax=Contarinia nasturtii TaxID=265458 RepID=UPI0012D45869|nr:uncharacterized protein LOC116338373 [Contarinia nasturtii]
MADHEKYLQELKDLLAIGANLANDYHERIVECVELQRLQMLNQHMLTCLKIHTQEISKAGNHNIDDINEISHAQADFSYKLDTMAKYSQCGKEEVEIVRQLKANIEATKNEINKIKAELALTEETQQMNRERNASAHSPARK